MSTTSNSHTKSSGSNRVGSYLDCAVDFSESSELLPLEQVPQDALEQNQFSQSSSVHPVALELPVYSSENQKLSTLSSSTPPPLPQKMGVQRSQKNLENKSNLKSTK